MKKKTLYLTILFIFIFSVQCFAMPLSPLDNGYLRLEINNNSRGNFNVRGYDVSKNLIQTTFGNSGYLTFLKVDNEETDISFFNSASVQYEDIVIEFAPEFIGENYFKIQYNLTNVSNKNKKISLGFHADIQIANDDKAPVTNIPGNKGFIMYSGENRFTLMCKNVPSLESVDTYWFGHYGQRVTNKYNQIEASSLTGVDSGMALSWQNRTLRPGETKSFSILLGVGEATAIDMFSEYDNIGDNTKLPVTIVAITSSGNILRIVDLKNNKVYYNGPIKDYIELPLDREGNYALQASIMDGNEIITQSKIININKLDILNKAIGILTLQNELNKFIIINEKDRFFENNSSNRDLVNKIKEKSSGTYLIFNEISPVLEPILEY